MKKLNNADVMPRWLPDDQVVMEGWHPDWVKSLVMAELRVESATPEGTFASAIRVLDHYEEMGVNALWLTPIQDKGETGNGYSNMGLHTISPHLTGKNNYVEGWQVFKEFVDAAHARNIRVYIDAIVWGTVKESPLVVDHPDWYAGKLEVWGGYKFNWHNQVFRDWYMQTAIDIVMKTGLDGYRVDLEPFVTGHTFFAQLRRELLARGRKISIFAECTSEREEAYDFDEQITNEDPERWHMHSMFTERHNIVDAIKTGKGHGTIYAQDNGKGGMARFYCLCLCCHDNLIPSIKGDRIVIGYQALFAPYIPLWFLGEEWNNPIYPDCGMFNNVIEWELLDDPSHAAFYEDVKKMIRLKRIYGDILDYAPDNHREANICAVKSNCGLQAYARYLDGRALLILPNIAETEQTLTAVIPVEEAGLTAIGTVREVLHDAPVKVDGTNISVTVPLRDMAVILVDR